VRRRSLVDRDVPAIGSGDISLATAAARGLDARDVERALHHALELGIRLVDVQPDSDSERLVGQTVRALRLRDLAVVATTVPVLEELAGKPKRDLLPERLPARYVQDQIEVTLRATQLDALTLAQLPLRAAWRTSNAWPELVGTCARLVREGKVIAWGAILDDLDEPPLAFTTEPWLTALHVTYNLCERAAEPLLAAATEHQMAVLARRPLAGGALAGSLGPGATLKPRDDRNALDLPTLERIAVEVARLAPLVRTEPPAARSCEAAKAVLAQGRRPDHVECATLAELALRFAVDRGAIPLPRIHRHEHVTEAVAAVLAAPLGADLLARILDEKPAARA
jgi:aryl-alcohol dehydrogenase-like predicted oxidoreductase